MVDFNMIYLNMRHLYAHIAIFIKNNIKHYKWFQIVKYRREKISDNKPWTYPYRSIR